MKSIGCGFCGYCATATSSFLFPVSGDEGGGDISVESCPLPEPDDYFGDRKLVPPELLPEQLEELGEGFHKAIFPLLFIRAVEYYVKRKEKFESLSLEEFELCEIGYTELPQRASSLFDEPIAFTLRFQESIWREEALQVNFRADLTIDGNDFGIFITIKPKKQKSTVAIPNIFYGA
jgi:hypothetical protein